MANQYRVDTSKSHLNCPAGTNSLIYLGDNEATARWWLANGKQGVCPWGKADAAYGLILSRWDATQQTYKVIAYRGFFNGEGKL